MRKNVPELNEAQLAMEKHLLDGFTQESPLLEFELVDVEPKPQLHSKFKIMLNELMMVSILVVWKFGVAFFLVFPSELMLRSKPKLISPPGSWARAVLSFVFSKKTFEQVYAQGIADLRDDYFEALAEGRLWEARKIVLSYYIRLVLTIGGWSLTSVLKKLVGLWKIGL